MYGVPFRFIPTVAASREPNLKPSRHVRAEPDRTAKLEITFPLVAGYHMETPDAPLIADLSIPEARIVLSKSDVRTETIVSGLVGKPDVHSPDDLRAVRSQRLAYRLAARALENQLRSEEGDLRPWYFPQLLPIVRDDRPYEDRRGPGGWSLHRGKPLPAPVGYLRDQPGAAGHRGRGSLPKDDPGQPHQGEAGAGGADMPV